MSYTFDATVRFSEVDRDGVIKLGALINYLQDCSTLHSESIGYGVNALKAMHRAWILASWQVEIDRYPQLNEKITIGTLPHDFKNVFGYRNFFIKDSSGAMIVRANTIWVYIDTESGKPVRPGEDEMKAYGKEEPLEMEVLSRRIKVPAGEWSVYDSLPVRRAHLDTNDHVNNGQYIQMAAEYIPEDFKPARLRVDYKNAARLGDIICPRLAKEEDRTVVDLRSTDDKTYCIIEFR